MIPKRCWIILLSLCATGAAFAGILTVNVTTEGPREGMIDILVFKEKKGFPNKPQKAFLQKRFPVSVEGSVTCIFTDLPYGIYSLSVLHDVNNNDKADKMLGVGPPKEPVGFSNISLKPRGQPKFEETLFTFNAETNTVSVPLFYVF